MIRLGIRELREEDVLESGRIRRKSKGHPRLEESYPNLYDYCRESPLMDYIELAKDTRNFIEELSHKY